MHTHRSRRAKGNRKGVRADGRLAILTRQMTPLQVLATGIDGTKDTKASWTTPDVTPYSKIYFLQL